jgi:hypothetical protein
MSRIGTKPLCDSSTGRSGAEIKLPCGAPTQRRRLKSYASLDNCRLSPKLRSALERIYYCLPSLIAEYDDFDAHAALKLRMIRREIEELLITKKPASAGAATGIAEATALLVQSTSPWSVKP